LADRLRVSLPAVLTVQTGINEPRHPNLRAIKLAEREAIEVFAGTQIDPAYRVRRMFVPASNSQAKPLGADVREAAKSLARIIKERSG
jgi:electron transfer flavoprotein beta subunit